MTTLLHIAHTSDWADARETGEYRWSSRGLTLEAQGFIHCSEPHQVERVAHAIYADDPESLVVLVMESEAIAASGTELLFEDGGDGELFPHVYGPIRSDWVTGVQPAAFVDGVFTY